MSMPRTLHHRHEAHEIVGCAMEVLNTLGHGFHEKSYENALVAEFRLRSIDFKQQPRFDVRYKGVLVGQYVPNLVVFEKIVVEAMSVERLGHHETGQMINYLKVTGNRVGILINFKHAKLEWQRVAI